MLDNKSTAQMLRDVAQRLLATPRTKKASGTLVPIDLYLLDEDSLRQAFTDYPLQSVSTALGELKPIIDSTVPGDAKSALETWWETYAGPASKSARSLRNMVKWAEDHKEFEAEESGTPVLVNGEYDDTLLASIEDLGKMLKAKEPPESSKSLYATIHKLDFAIKQHFNYTDVDPDGTAKAIGEQKADDAARNTNHLKLVGESTKLQGAGQKEDEGRIVYTPSNGSLPASTLEEAGKLAVNDAPLAGALSLLKKGERFVFDTKDPAFSGDQRREQDNYREAMAENGSAIMGTAQVDTVREALGYLRNVCQALANREEAKVRKDAGGKLVSDRDPDRMQELNDMGKEARKHFDSIMADSESARQREALIHRASEELRVWADGKGYKVSKGSGLAYILDSVKDVATRWMADLEGNASTPAEKAKLTGTKSEVAPLLALEPRSEGTITIPYVVGVLREAERLFGAAKDARRIDPERQKADKVSLSAVAKSLQGAMDNYRENYLDTEKGAASELLGSVQGATRQLIRWAQSGRVPSKAPGKDASVALAHLEQFLAYCGNSEIEEDLMAAPEYAEGLMKKFEKVVSPLAPGAMPSTDGKPSTEQSGDYQAFHKILASVSKGGKNMGSPEVAEGTPAPSADTAEQISKLKELWGKRFLTVITPVMDKLRLAVRKPNARNLHDLLDKLEDTLRTGGDDISESSLWELANNSSFGKKASFGRYADDEKLGVSHSVYSGLMSELDRIVRERPDFSEPRPMFRLLAILQGLAVRVHKDFSGEEAGRAPIAIDKVEDIIREVSEMKDEMHDSVRESGSEADKESQGKYTDLTKKHVEAAGRKKLEADRALKAAADTHALAKLIAEESSAPQKAEELKKLLAEAEGVPGSEQKQRGLRTEIDRATKAQKLSEGAKAKATASLAKARSEYGALNAQAEDHKKSGTVMPAESVKLLHAWRQEATKFQDALAAGANPELESALAHTHVKRKREAESADKAFSKYVHNKKVIPELAREDILNDAHSEIENHEAALQAHDKVGIEGMENLRTLTGDGKGIHNTWELNAEREARLAAIKKAKDTVEGISGVNYDKATRMHSSRPLMAKRQVETGRGAIPRRDRLFNANLDAEKLLEGLYLRGGGKLTPEGIKEGVDLAMKEFVRKLERRMVTGPNAGMTEQEVQDNEKRKETRENLKKAQETVARHQRNVQVIEEQITHVLSNLASEFDKKEKFEPGAENSATALFNKIYDKDKKGFSGLSKGTNKRLSEIKKVNTLLRSWLDKRSGRKDQSPIYEEQKWFKDRLHQDTPKGFWDSILKDPAKYADYLGIGGNGVWDKKLEELRKELVDLDAQGAEDKSGEGAKDRDAKRDSILRKIEGIAAKLDKNKNDGYWDRQKALLRAQLKEGQSAQAKSDILKRLESIERLQNHFHGVSKEELAESTDPKTGRRVQKELGTAKANKYKHTTPHDQEAKSSLGGMLEKVRLALHALTGKEGKDFQGDTAPGLKTLQKNHKEHVRSELAKRDQEYQEVQERIADLSLDHEEAAAKAQEVQAELDRGPSEDDLRAEKRKLQEALLEARAAEAEAMESAGMEKKSSLQKLAEALEGDEDPEDARVPRTEAERKKTKGTTEVGKLALAVVKAKEALAAHNAKVAKLQKLKERLTDLTEGRLAREEKLKELLPESRSLRSAHDEWSKGHVALSAEHDASLEGLKAAKEAHEEVKGFIKSFEGLHADKLSAVGQLRAQEKKTAEDMEPLAAEASRLLDIERKLRTRLDKAPRGEETDRLKASLKTAQQNTKDNAEELEALQQTLDGLSVSIQKAESEAEGARKSIDSGRAPKGLVRDGFPGLRADPTMGELTEHAKALHQALAGHHAKVKETRSALQRKEDEGGILEGKLKDNRDKINQKDSHSRRLQEIEAERPELEKEMDAPEIPEEDIKLLEAAERRLAAEAGNKDNFFEIPVFGSDTGEVRKFHRKDKERSAEKITAECDEMLAWCMSHTKIYKENARRLEEDLKNLEDQGGTPETPETRKNWAVDYVRGLWVTISKIWGRNAKAFEEMTGTDSADKTKTQASLEKRLGLLGDPKAKALIATLGELRKTLSSWSGNTYISIKRTGPGGSSATKEPVSKRDVVQRYNAMKERAMELLGTYAEVKEYEQLEKAFTGALVSAKDSTAVDAVLGKDVPPPVQEDIKAVLDALPIPTEAELSHTDEKKELVKEDAPAEEELSKLALDMDDLLASVLAGLDSQKAGEASSAKHASELVAHKVDPDSLRRGVLASFLDKFRV